ncbi:MAG: hypothetical protein K2L07_03680 [Lachnospiraceae bacterium]|nr:hypothetical protein [Lachnospiraceae bacterium]
MLKLQEKLFFRSMMRTVLLLLWLAGSTGYYIHLQSLLDHNDVLLWNATGVFFMQLRACYFFFVIMALLAFDYFREVPDADLLEMVRTGGCCFKNDCIQFFVLLQAVLLSGVIMFIFQLSYFQSRNALTTQTLSYLAKVSSLYIGLNGGIAILLGWFLSRRMNKIMGYVSLLLFCIVVSPNMVTNFNYVMAGEVRLTKFFREFYIMPEVITVDEMIIGNYVTLIPVHLPHLCRGLFWLFLFMAVIAGCYRFKGRKIVGAAFLCMMAGSFFVMLLPASYYSANNSYDEADANNYPYMYYISPKHEQKEKEAPYVFLDYDMNIQLGQRMKINTVLKPSEKNLKTYDMTLYHLYEIEHVTDQDGRELSYERAGDYITVYNDLVSLEEIVITYEGGCANFYSNAQELYLPAAFPYYPLPGFRVVYDTELQEYVDNRLDMEAYFDVAFTSKSRVYSDLPEASENHFVGRSRGNLFVSGFYQEKELEDGAVCIYPYVEPYTDISIEANRTMYPLVLEYLENNSIWKNPDKKKFIFVPHVVGCYFAYITENALVAPEYSWESLAHECERDRLSEWYSGREDEISQSESEWIDTYIYRYNFLKEEDPEEVTYDKLKQMYMDGFAEYRPEECTDEMFDQFLIKCFGEEEFEKLKGEE